MAKIRIWNPLTDVHKDELILLAVHAHQLSHRMPSMKKLATYLIKLAAWRWTADAVDAITGIVVLDAIKTNIGYLPHSSEAALISAQYPKELSRRLTHEHTIPLKLLAERVFSLETSDKIAIREIFDCFCHAALITKEEDRRLNSAKLRSAMPSGWRFGDDLLARYTAIGIDLLPPLKDQKIACDLKENRLRKSSR